MMHLPFVLAWKGMVALAHGATAAAAGHAAAAPVAHAALAHAAAAHVTNAAIHQAAGAVVNQAASAGAVHAAVHVTPLVTQPALLPGPISSPGPLDHAMALFEESVLVAGAGKIIKEVTRPGEVRDAGLELLSEAPKPVPEFSASDFSF